MTKCLYLCIGLCFKLLKSFIYTVKERIRKLYNNYIGNIIIMNT